MGQCAGTHTKEKKKTAKISSEQPKISRVNTLPWKNTRSSFLSTFTYVKEKERNGQDYQKYALFVPFYRVALFLSLSLFCSFAVLFLCSTSFSSSFRAFVCVCLCLCVCLWAARSSSRCFVSISTTSFLNMLLCTDFSSLYYLTSLF